MPTALAVLVGTSLGDDKLCPRWTLGRGGGDKLVFEVADSRRDSSNGWVWIFADQNCEVDGFPHKLRFTE